MKQLKFMLAAATVIGLATAAQAAATDQFATSTGFEEFELNATISGRAAGKDSEGISMPSYFYYNSTEANDSTIVSDTPDVTTRPKGTKYFSETQAGNAKVLNVNTGTDPLLRTMNPVTGDTMPAAVTLSADTYVDTLVQFTVTPLNDEVEAKTGDKLMVYLKEAGDKDTGVITGTNLVVKAGFLTTSGVESKDYVVNTGNIKVEAGNWYRLTVKAIPNLATAEGFYYPAFSISINGGDWCSFDSGAVDNNDDALALALAACGETNFAILNGTTVVLPLDATGTTPATLSAVGFAGEGYVDDFIVTTEDPLAADPTGIDFTLTLGTGVSAVTYTIAGVEGEVTVNETTQITHATAPSITVTAIDYVFGYVANGDATGDYNTNVTIGATPVEFSDGTGSSSATSAAQMGITEGAFAGATAGSQELLDLMTWAKAKGATISMINAMTFSGDNVSTEDAIVPEEAYLLNCDLTYSAIDQAKKEFVLTAEDLAKLMDPENTEKLSVENKGYNGDVVIEGATTLSDPNNNNKPNWGTEHAEPKFYRARLTK